MSTVAKIERIKGAIYNTCSTVQEIKVLCTESYFKAFTESEDVKAAFNYFVYAMEDKYYRNEVVPHGVKWMQFNGVIFQQVKDVEESVGVIAVLVNGKQAPVYIQDFDALVKIQPSELELLGKQLTKISDRLKELGVKL